MILILIAIIAAAIVAVALLLYSTNDYETRNAIAGISGLALGLATGVAAVSYAFAGWHYIAAGTKAEVINREYGTHYTQAEVFFASDVIDTIRQLDRKRVEVNGDLFREQPDK